MIMKKVQYATTAAACMMLPAVTLGFTTTTHLGSQKIPFTSTPTSTSTSFLPLASLPGQKKILTLNQWQRYASMNMEDEELNFIEAEITRKDTKATRKFAKKHIQGIHPMLLNQWNKLRKNAKKSTHKAASLMAAAFIMFTVMFAPFSSAFAAPSGGRMGGSFGGSSSRQSSSRSYSSPSRSSYNRGYNQGYRSGSYNSRPNVIVAPSRPNVIVTPSLGGWGYNSPYYSPSGVAVIRRGPSVADVFIFGVFAFIMYSVLFRENDFDDSSSSALTSALGPGVTVAQISVALNVPQKDSPSSILTYLSRLSRTAQTDSRVGVSDLVSQVAMELLRQRRSVFAASSKYTHYRNGDKAQRDYSALAIKERSKFERESISNYGGVDYGNDNAKNKSLSGYDSFSPQATAAVVTIILSIDGDSTKLPKITSMGDLEKALTAIASDVKVDDCLRSAEVLWTPEDSDDTLSQTDVIVDYPELRNI